MNIRRVSRKLGLLSWTQRSLLLEAIVLLGVVRTAILLVPFRYIARTVGLEAGESSFAPGSMQEAQQRGWAVRTAAAYTPWLSTCLAQALAVALLLRQRRIPCTLYLGVDSSHRAHAWARSGTEVLTGANAREGFVTVAAFSTLRDLLHSAR